MGDVLKMTGILATYMEEGLVLLSFIISILGAFGFKAKQAKIKIKKEAEDVKELLNITPIKNEILLELAEKNKLVGAVKAVVSLINR